MSRIRRTIQRNEASPEALKLVADLRDVLSNEEAWRIADEALHPVRAKRDELRSLLAAVQDGIAIGHLGHHRLPVRECPCSLHQMVRLLEIKLNS